MSGIEEHTIGASSEPRTRFRYRAASRDGRVHRGVTLARGRTAAHRSISEQGLFLISMEEATDGDIISTGSRRSSAGDVALGLRALTTLLQAGLPLPRAIRSTERIAPRSFARHMSAVADSITRGSQLSDALTSSGLALSPVVLGVLKAGERVGDLGAATEHAARVAEEGAAGQAAIRGALAYPFGLLIVGALSIGVLVLRVLPKLEVLLADMGGKLPVGAKSLMSAAPWIAFAAGALAIGGCVVALSPTMLSPSVRRRIDAFLLTTPMIGPWRRTLLSGRICTALGATVTAGIPILAALEQAADATGNREVIARLEIVRTRIVEGSSIGAAFEEQEILSDIALGILKTGEESGSLGVMLSRAGTIESERAARGLRTLARVLEPTLILVFGGIIAFVATAVLQSIHSVRIG